MLMPKNNLKIAYLSTWPPRPCGIATFTYDLAHAIERIDPKIEWEVIAINEPGAKYKYDEKVSFIIKQEDFGSYKKAAEYINSKDFDLLNLQHEYNLYGGELGEWLTQFLSLIKKPIVTALHTVPFPELWPGKNPKKKIEILKEIIKQSQKLVTMCKAGFKKLNQEYKSPSKKISIIPHGGPEIKKITIKKAKEKLNIPSTTHLLSSYGLIRRDKNYEVVIKALPKILSVFPETIFLICGQEHPLLSVNYYKDLKKIVLNSGLKEKVIFVDHYLTLEEITQYLQATDIYIHASYILSLASSGTLTYAMIAGKCIISTPFVYAEEVLSKGRGILVPVNDPEALAFEVIKLLRNPVKKQEMEEKMWKFGQQFTWPNIGKKYVRLFREVINGKA